MTLAELMQAIASATGTHVGKWGTPEYSITEKLGDPNVRNAEGGSVLGTADVNEMLGPNFKTGEQILAERNAGTLITPGNPTGTWPASTGGGNTGGGNTGVATGGDTSGTDTARAIYDANLARIRNIFDETKRVADDVRARGMDTFNNLLKSIGAFRDRAGVLRDNAGQEIINTASEILGSNARSGREATGVSRAMGRAMGLGDSSKFNNQNKVLSSLIGTQGSTLANKGENVRANQAEYSGRIDQADAQESEANTYLKGVNDSASSLERSGLNDFGGNVDIAGATFAKMLADVKANADAIKAINPVNAGGLTQYAPNTSGITNTINGVLASLGGGNMGTSVETNANPYSSPTYAEYLKRRAGTYKTS